MPSCKLGSCECLVMPHNRVGAKDKKPNEESGVNREVVTIYLKSLCPSLFYNSKLDRSQYNMCSKGWTSNVQFRIFEILYLFYLHYICCSKQSGYINTGHFSYIPEPRAFWIYSRFSYNSSTMWSMGGMKGERKVMKEEGETAEPEGVAHIF